MQNLHLLGTGDTTTHQTMTLLSAPSHNIRVEQWRSESLKAKENKKLLDIKKDTTMGSGKANTKKKMKTDSRNDDHDIDNDNDDDNVQEIQIEIPLAYVNKWNKNNR
ncbi:hypothetical protein DOY81_010600 [Sarcophaga bullata]|nr:hypothetical protein DOY81_010600 [Sarcophaga bullata]